MDEVKRTLIADLKRLNEDDYERLDIEMQLNKLHQKQHQDWCKIAIIGEMIDDWKEKFQRKPSLDDFINEKQITNSTIQKQQLTIEQQKHIDSISRQINPQDNEGLLTFGSDLQKQMSQFSHQMLDEVQSKDVGPIGDTLSDLMSKLKSVNPNELNTEKNSLFKKSLAEPNLLSMKFFKNAICQCSSGSYNNSTSETSKSFNKRCWVIGHIIW